MGKTKEIIIPYNKPKLHWLIKKGFRRLMLTPWEYTIPDLKYFKKHGNK